MIRACVAVGGWRTARTLPRRWIRSCRRADFDCGFALMVVTPLNISTIPRPAYRGPAHRAEVSVPLWRKSSALIRFARGPPRPKPIRNVMKDVWRAIVLLLIIATVGGS